MNQVCAQVNTPNDLAYLPLVQGFVQQIPGMAGMPATEAGRLNLALEEAFTNILRYGFEEGVEEEVAVRFECAAGDARVTLSYRGLPFDSEQILDHRPNLDAGHRAPRPKPWAFSSAASGRRRPGGSTCCSSTWAVSCTTTRGSRWSPIRAGHSWST